ncbi:hypothetical protein [Microbacterium sp. Leaf320]|uniref:hypothetical protein n=1 Tax=Microbacterium sp. Leaf320 TaxID=1736334 RepID=UPI0006F99DF9|nr:hypothetical protein [Microbacterium sp. Leaf320]KQQ62561.1 hypothetical protein ASF63_18640 [Microbacterium sp. Leaf320]
MSTFTPQAGGGRPPFAVEDEGYIGLEIDDEVEVLASHDFDGHTRPLIWQKEYRRACVVVDALGRDPRAYDGAEHVALLRAAMGRAVTHLDGVSPD